MLTINKINKEANFIRNLNKQLVRKDPVLNLSYERMGDAGIVFICESKDLSHVRELDLSWNEISDKGLQKLTSCNSLQNLNHLILNSNQNQQVHGINQIFLQHLLRNIHLFQKHHH